MKMHKILLVALAAHFGGAWAQSDPGLTDKTIKIGMFGPLSGNAMAYGFDVINAAKMYYDKVNKEGGIHGRKIELVIEDESSPKDTIERFSKLVQQEKVDCVQGIISTGVGLALGPVVEEARALTIYWDGTTQDGVKETLANPRYVFFREEPLSELDARFGPRGAQGVPLTPGRSIAVDRDSIPYGTPVWLRSQGPVTSLDKLVLAQDTGTAIVGAVRADYYAGSGTAAGELAGRMKQPLQLWVLWPK